MKNTRVYILYTGGTIGMAPIDENDPYSPLEPKPLASLLNFVPGFKSDNIEPDNFLSHEAKELANINRRKPAKERLPFLELDNGKVIEFGSGGFDEPVDSSDVQPDDWKKMARMIFEVYDDYNGFIILHGTDTMAFTASGLSFICENLGKPIVITGSQLPISSTRTDAVLNLVNAIHIAGYKATDLPPIPEVIISFADRIIRGCRASKISTSDWAGFDSPNFPLLGTIGEHIKINTNYLLRVPTSDKKFYIATDLDEHVFLINLFPGFTNMQIEKLLSDPTIKGYVLRTYGTGNVPSNPEFLSLIREAIKNDKVVVNLSQCSIGTVEMGLYEASSGLLECGVLSGLDMTPEAAITKLMWTLGTQFKVGRWLQMQINQRGEQTENLFDLRFGGLDKKKADPTYTNRTQVDGRLNRDQISNAMLRVSALGVTGVKKGAKVKVHVFMNMPSADLTTLDDERHIATLIFTWQGIAKTRMATITYKTQTVIGKGEVILKLITDQPNVKIYFQGLYIAIYAKA